MNDYDGYYMSLVKEQTFSDLHKYPLEEKMADAALGLAEGLHSCEKKVKYLQYYHVVDCIRDAIEAGYRAYWSHSKIESKLSLNSYNASFGDAVDRGSSERSRGKLSVEEAVILNDFINSLTMKEQIVCRELVLNRKETEICDSYHLTHTDFEDILQSLRTAYYNYFSEQQ